MKNEYKDIQVDDGFYNLYRRLPDHVEIWDLIADNVFWECCREGEATKESKTELEAVAKMLNAQSGINPSDRMATLVNHMITQVSIFLSGDEYEAFIESTMQKLKERHKRWINEGKF
jgi:hypothetical protein